MSGSTNPSYLDLGTVLGPDGGSVAYQVSGRADAAPVVLLGGRGNSHRWWDGVRAYFDERFTTITFDYRGTGGSIDPQLHYLSHMDWSTTLFARDAAAVLDHLGVTGAHVYGTSTGSLVGQVLAAERPDLLARLALASTSPGGAAAIPADSEVRRILRQSLPTPGTEREVLGLLYTRQWLRRPGARSSLLGEPGMSATARRAHLRVGSAHDAWELLPDIAAETLVLQGQDDPIFPVGNAELVADRIPRARLSVSPGRHAFFDEFRDTVNPWVVGFLGA